MADNDTEDMDKVIARIQKMLARTKVGSGTSEAEAQTAMQLAQELMMKHNLDMAVIEAASDDKVRAVERVREESRGKVRYKWQRELAKYVAEANFCYHLIKFDSKWRDGRYVPCDQPGDHADHVDDGAGGHSCFKNDKTGVYEYYVRGGRQTTAQHVLVGRKANVITATLMFQYLTNTIEELVPLENTQQRFSRSAMSWKEGCADRLCERLADKRRDLIAQNDARIKQEDADRKAEAQAKYEAAQKGKAKELPANEEAEVASAVEGLKAQAHHPSGSSIDPDPERPEADASDTWNPAAAAEDPPEESETAMVLASVYDEREREANYEAAHGLPPGTIAKRRAEREAQEREEAEEAAKEETAQIERPVREETERQRAARERREREEWAKQRRRWARESDAEERRAQREYDKRDHDAYKAGADAGKKIGLDLQIAARKDAKKLTS